MHPRFTHATGTIRNIRLAESKLKPSFIMSHNTKVIGAVWFWKSCFDWLGRIGHLYMYLFNSLWNHIIPPSVLYPSPPFSLYTILPCTIWYGVWHTNGGSEVGRRLRNNSVIVLQPFWQCRWGGAIQGWLIRAQKARRETMYCKGQPPLTFTRHCHYQY